MSNSWGHFQSTTAFRRQLPRLITITACFLFIYFYMFPVSCLKMLEKLLLFHAQCKIVES